MQVIDRARQLLSKSVLLAGGAALSGIAVQGGVESTGIRGPSVEALLTQREQNFREVYSRLDALRERTFHPEAIRQRDRLTDGEDANIGNGGQVFGLRVSAPVNTATAQPG
jgi:hypothetical protein